MLYQIHLMLDRPVSFAQVADYLPEPHSLTSYLAIKLCDLILQLFSLSKEDINRLSALRL
jgi:hypothetical protein